jgi:hypothetical protein
MGQEGKQAFTFLKKVKWLINIQKDTQSHMEYWEKKTNQSNKK